MSKNISNIPLNQPVLKGNEKKYLIDAIDHNWISFGGPYTAKFEAKFAEFLGVKHALACSSGTSAIHLALLSLGIGPGDEVIIPDLAIIADAHMPILVGAKPVVVDVDAGLGLDPTKIETKITKKTKAILVVHMYGNPANMPEIMRIAKKHGLLVIEDACSALGAEIIRSESKAQGTAPHVQPPVSSHPTPASSFQPSNPSLQPPNSSFAGTIGDVGCFSTYSTKLVTTGEGGMVVTNNGEVAEKIKLFRDYGHHQPRFTHQVLAFNYRLTDLQAAIGLAQLEKIGQNLIKKRQIGQNYAKLLQKLGETVSLVPEPAWGRALYWNYPVLINQSFGLSRDQIMVKMREKGIETSQFFVPMSQQPVFMGQNLNQVLMDKNYPISHDLADKGLLLPSGLNLTLAQQKRVVETFINVSFSAK